MPSSILPRNPNPNASILCAPKFIAAGMRSPSTCLPACPACSHLRPSITPRRCRLSEARPSEARDINALFAAPAFSDVCCLCVSLAVLTLTAAWQQRVALCRQSRTAVLTPVCGECTVWPPAQSAQVCWRKHHSNCFLQPAATQEARTRRRQNSTEPRRRSAPPVVRHRNQGHGNLRRACSAGSACAACIASLPPWSCASQLVHTESKITR